MIKFLCLLSVTAFYIIKDIECSNIYDALRNYYDSDIHQQFEKEWKKYRRAFENEIASNLQENFGTKALNIYEPDRRDAHFLAGGFHLTDGVVMVLILTFLEHPNKDHDDALHTIGVAFKGAFRPEMCYAMFSNICNNVAGAAIQIYFFEMVLRELPALIGTKLNIDLSSNHVKLESKVDRMFIDTSYYVARNSSSVIYASPDDQKELSPFSLQQVDNLGKVVIVVEDCSLSGISIATLSGDSVNIGHCTFMLSNCKFTVEISTPNSGAPPVIAPYFPKGPKEKLEIVISKPIREELHTKLQGAMYSYINTSVVLGSQASNFRNSQHQLFKSYAEFMTDYVAKVNQKTLKANKGHVNLANYEILMNTETDKRRWQCHMALRDVTLYGLDTAYVARSGGPYNDGSGTNTAADAITFSSIQIRGKVTHDDGKGSITYDFAAELTDITVNIIIDIQEGQPKLRDILLTGWRSLEFSIIPWETQYKERHGYQSLVYGHILNEIPVRIIDHLTTILGAPIDGTTQDGDGDGSDENNGGDVSDNDKEGRSENGGVDDNDYNLDNTAKDKQLKNKNEKDFFSDGLDENFFSDNEFFSDDAIDEKFFSDDNVQKDFLSEFETDSKKDNVEGKDVSEGDEVLRGEEPSVNGDVESEVVDNEGVDDDDGELMAVSDAEQAEVLKKTGDNGGVNDDDEGDVDTPAEADVGADDDAVADSEGDVGVDNEAVADTKSNTATFKSADNDGHVGNKGKLKSVNGDGGWHISTVSDKEDMADDNGQSDGVNADASEETNMGVDDEAIGGHDLQSVNGDGAWLVSDDAIDEEDSVIPHDGFNKQVLDGSQLKSVKGDGFLSDDFIDKDFFSDDNIKEDFISDMTAENNKAALNEAVEDGAESAVEDEDKGAVEDKDEGAVEDEDEVAIEDVEGRYEEAVEDDDEKQINDDHNMKKDFLSDDHIQKDFLSDDQIEKDFFSDDHIEKDFFSDDHIEKDFFSDDHIEKDFFSDDHIEDNFFSDDNLEKDFFSDDNTNSQGDVAANGLQSVNGDEGWEVSDDAINEEDDDNNLGGKEKDGADIKASSVEDNNGEIADNDSEISNDKQNAGDTGAKKMWVFASEEDKPFLDEHFFSDDSIERRSMANKSQRHDENGHTDDINSSEDKKVVLPSNVHNTRRQQNRHMSENEIR